VPRKAGVGDGLAAADGPAVGAVVQPAQGALDGVQPAAQALRDGVILPFGRQRLRGIGRVSGLAVHLGLAVLLACRLGVLQQALHLVALGNEQAARAVLVHRAVLPNRCGTRQRPVVVFVAVGRAAHHAQHSEAAGTTLVEATDRDYRLYVLSDGTEDPDEQARDVLLGRIFPRRAQVIDTAALRTLLQGT